MNEKEKKDLVLSKVVLVVLAVLGLLVILWLSWLAPAAKKTDITSFEQCAKAGNPIQESYPEVCVTKDGKRFTNTTQNIQNMAIDEWGLAIMITGVSDAYYTYDSTTDQVFVSTRTLDAAAKLVKGCTAGMRGLTYQRVQLGQTKEDGTTWTEADLTDAAKVGQYYYVQAPVIDILCMPDQDDTHVKTVNAHKEALKAAMRSAQAE